MSDAEFKDWLSGAGRRITLVEVDLAAPLYLATVAYTTLPDDSPANRVYLPYVAHGFAFSESLALSGEPSISVGAIDLRNDDGALDAWLEQIWTNRAVRVYIGDVSWPRADFRLVFDGIAAQLNVSGNRLSIVLRDKLQRLNTPITEAELGGSTNNKDRLIPLTFGECHNVEPLLIDPAQHQYQVHAGAVERIIEVRDNGVPVATTDALGSGTFKLTKSPVGTITASVQGRSAGGYSNTIAGIVQAMATQYGKVADRLVSGDLDSVSLSAFDSAHPEPVGYHVRDRANVLQACQELAASVGAQVVMSRTGKLRLLQLALPGSGTPVTITPADYEAKSLTIKERPQVKAGVSLNFCRCWHEQAGLETGIPAEHKDLFAREWLNVTAKDAGVATAYRLHETPEAEDTCLLKRTDAQAEANRRLALWSVQRTVYQIRGFAQCLLLELGQAVTLTGNRFGLEAGKTGVVIGLQLDWTIGRATVEVLV